MRVATLVLGMAVLAAGCERHVFVNPASDGKRPLVLRSVRVFDARAAAVLDGTRDIVVRDGRILGIVSDAGEVPGAEELRGGLVVPGLIDAHVHLGGGSAPPWKPELPDEDENLEAFLYCGVTTVLDVGNRRAIFDTREAIARGERLGPRVFASGPIFTAPGGHPAAMVRLFAPSILAWIVAPMLAREVGTVAEASGEVAALAADRPDFIKIAVDRIPTDAPRIANDVLRAIVAASHSHKLRAVAHVGSSADVVDAVHAGIDALVHGVYTEPLSDAALDALAAKRIPVVATISVFDAQEHFAGTAPRRITALEQQVASAAVVDAFKSVPADFNKSAMEPWIRAVAGGHDPRRENVRRMRERGITVLAGSDSPNIGHFGGAGLHKELDWLVEAGMTPGEALRAATIDNARFLAGEDADFGEIAVGKRADLLVLRAAALDSIAAVHDIEAVIVNGVKLSRHARAAK